MRALVLSLLLLSPTFGWAAAPEEETVGERRFWYLHAGGYVHYSDDEDYEGPNWFVGLERHYDHQRGGPMVGFSVFNNSFGDVSEYLYWGWQFNPWEKHPGFRIKLTIGVVHGYEGENLEIFPINWGDAWGIGAVPTIGFQKNRTGFDLALLSNSGILFLIGREF